MRRTLRLLAFALPVAAAACLGEDPIAPAPESEEGTFAPALGVDLAASTETSTGLWYRDLAAGTGASLSTGDTAYVTYTGNFANGNRFDSGKFPFAIGRNAVIAGFDEGVRSMKVGGRRQLIIPPHLGYGPQWDMSGTIPPNSVLVFDVKLDSVKTPAPE